jgi:hypothetical protein
MPDVAVQVDRRMPIAQDAGSASRQRRKFSGLQSLENSQNAERISIFRQRVSIATADPQRGNAGNFSGNRGKSPGGRVLWGIPKTLEF